MEQKTLARWLKIILAGIALCGLAVYGGILPLLGQEAIGLYPEFSHLFWPWMIFLLLSGLPCFAVLYFGLGIVRNIEADRSFSEENASLFRKISYLAAGDSAYFFLGNFIFLLLDANHPAVALASLIVVVFGVAIAVAAAALSHLVHKAAVLQKENDLTI